MDEYGTVLYNFDITIISGRKGWFKVCLFQKNFSFSSEVRAAKAIPLRWQAPFGEGRRRLELRSRCASLTIIFRDFSETAAPAAILMDIVPLMTTSISCSSRTFLTLAVSSSALRSIGTGCLRRQKRSSTACSAITQIHIRIQPK